MPKYVTPDFDVTVYEIDEKITADILSYGAGDENGGDNDWSDIL